LNWKSEPRRARRPSRWRLFISTQERGGCIGLKRKLRARGFRLGKARAEGASSGGSSAISLQFLSGITPVEDMVRIKGPEYCKGNFSGCLNVVGVIWGEQEQSSTRLGVSFFKSGGGDGKAWVQGERRSGGPTKTAAPAATLEKEKETGTGFPEWA